MKKFLALAMALAMTASLAACGGSGSGSAASAAGSSTSGSAAQGVASGVEDGVLTVAMECGYAPYNWSQPDDSNGAVPIKDSNEYANGYDVMMAQKLCHANGWQLEIVSQNVTELGGVKEVCATVEGDGAWSRLKFEAGTHRVQRVPETESGGRIQTSAATVAVMPEAEETELSIDPKDLQIDTFRSSGAGGQHVNKTESAIRITHLPTGTVVECQDERSQYKNKDRAMKILRSKLYEAEQARQNAEIAATRRSQVGTGDRSGKIRTYNFPQNRVTDHRLTGDSKNFNLAAVINGDLDALIDALTLADQTRRLQEGYEKGE